MANVQRGQASLTSAAKTTVTLGTPVNPNKTMVIMQQTVAQTAPTNNKATVRLRKDTTLYFHNQAATDPNAAFALNESLETDDATFSSAILTSSLAVMWAWVTDGYGGITIPKGQWNFTIRIRIDPANDTVSGETTWQLKIYSRSGGSNTLKATSAVVALDIASYAQVAVSVEVPIMVLGAGDDIYIELLGADSSRDSDIQVNLESSGNQCSVNRPTDLTTITSTDQLEFLRNGTTGTLLCNYQVVTHDSLKVQHDSFDTLSGDTTTNQTITAVDTNHAFPILSWQGVATAANALLAFFRGKITTSTNLAAVRNTSGVVMTIAYQIVEFMDGTWVEYEQITISAAASSNTVNLTKSVVIADSFLWGSFSMDTARTDCIPRWKYNSTSQLIATRAGTTGITIVDLYSVWLPTSAITQDVAITDVGNPTSQAITAVAATAKTFTFMSMSGSGITTNWDRGQGKTDLTTTSNVDCSIDTTTDTNAAELQVVELPWEGPYIAANQPDTEVPLFEKTKVVGY